MVQTQISPTLERWSEIAEFPGYSVSDWGRVSSAKSQSIITPTMKPGGLLMVGLMRDKKQHKRSLNLLVANGFVPPHPIESFDTPINLDGDQANNHYTNLMWRPLWFARKYKQQFVTEHMTYDGPIEDVETHITYENSFSAAVEHGLLEHEICIAMQNNLYVWPTGQIFREAL